MHANGAPGNKRRRQSVSRRRRHVRYDEGMKFLVSIYRDEDGIYIAECPAVPGCVSQGRTETEAEANISDAIRECLAVRAELGMPLSTVTREVAV